jgi:universal stress protein A
MKTKVETRRRRPGRPSDQPAGVVRTRSVLSPKRILVPLDFSKASLKALRYAVPFARQFGVQLYLVSVLEPASFLDGVENLALAMPDQALVEATGRKLLALAAEEIEEFVPVDVQVRIGKPFAEIVKLAADMHIDLIIIATHGYTGLKHVFLGSTAEQVVRRAPCPVLVVREREREFVQP